MRKGLIHNLFQLLNPILPRQLLLLWQLMLHHLQLRLHSSPLQTILLFLSDIDSIGHKIVIVQIGLYSFELECYIGLGDEILLEVGVGHYLLVY